MDATACLLAIQCRMHAFYLHAFHVSILAFVTQQLPPTLRCMIGLHQTCLLSPDESGWDYGRQLSTVDGFVTPWPRGSNCCHRAFPGSVKHVYRAPS
jgi:hypothetical protein